MKEAAGEANLTVIAILLIGVVAAVVTPMVNSAMQSTAKQGCCTNAGYVWQNGKCYPVYANGSINTSGGDKLGDVWDSTNKTCK
jgi:hypothetical protein